MTFVYLLLGMAAFCCFYGVYRSLANASSLTQRESSVVSQIPEPVMPQQEPGHYVRERSHWINTRDFATVLHANPGILLYRICTSSESLSEEYLPGENTLFVEQLQESLKWTPPASKVVIYIAGYDDPAIMRRIVSMALCREAFLVEDALPSNILKLAEIVGSIWRDTPAKVS
jgi:hypothetical protein